MNWVLSKRLIVFLAKIIYICDYG